MSKRLNAKKAPIPRRRDVRLYTPDNSTLELYVDNKVVLHLDNVELIEHDDGSRRTVIKPAA